MTAFSNTATTPSERLCANTTRLAVTTMGDAALESIARQHAHTMNLPYAETQQLAHFDLLLVHTPERLELHDCGDRRVQPMYVDFSNFDWRSHGPNLSRRQPLARAIGKKARTVVDATAGLAHDALLLAAMGYRVSAIERNAVCTALVRDGLKRLAANTLSHAALQRLHLIDADARATLPRLTPRPDVIYLDPMFPPKRKKSAAVKKEMRLLRALVGDDDDALQLFEISRHSADRIVVKRPDHAPPLAPNPAVSYSGKLVRYDVYPRGT